ncbi:hypothetical protein OEZ86_003697 [Tetradesmus obliquus]|nr:hypothetical protein OEZ86_003697 [Tetradesmus obliquus]
MEAMQQAKQAADRAFKQQQYQQAINKYSEALKASEDSLIADLLHVLYSNRAAAKLAVQDFHGALADAQSAVAVDDKWVKGWYRSAKALQGLGRLEAAAQAAGRALQLEPGNREVKALLQALKQQHDSNTSSNPASQPDGLNSNLMLLLHGLGDKPAAFTALAQRMQLPQTACLALSGPLEVPETRGGRAWFRAFDDDWELIQPQPGEKRRLNSLASTLALLTQQLLPALSAAGGWQPDQIQLLGFSQGGSVALELARCCTGSQRLGGVVAISAALLEEQLEQHAAPNGSSNSSTATSNSSSSSPVEAGTDALITHGDRDEVVPRSLVERSVAVLRKAGCNVSLQPLPGKGHSMISGPAEMRACMAFWAGRLKMRPPQADASYMEVPQEVAAAVLGDLKV